MADNTDNMQLFPTDIVGIIQRGLRDLDAYCMRPAETVDPGVIIGYLERVAGFAQRLPQPRMDAPAASDAGTEARPN